MELENTQNNDLAKLLMLKLGEYEMWEIRIKHYFQIQDYALWEVIENGNSWVPIPVTTPPEIGTSTTTMMTVPATIKEKTCKKNDLGLKVNIVLGLKNLVMLRARARSQPVSWAYVRGLNAAIKIVTARTRKVTIVRVKKQFEYGSYLKLSIWGYYMFLVLGCEEDIGMKHIFVLGKIGAVYSPCILACALRNFDLEVMELDNTQNNALAKLPMLKLGEYEMWEIRIKQYFQIQALWEVIENGNSWVPIPVTTPPESGTSTTTKMTVPATIEEKTCKKNDVKARRSTLIGTANNINLLDNMLCCNAMIAAIKARFGAMEATNEDNRSFQYGMKVLSETGRKIIIDGAILQIYKFKDGVGFDWSDMAEEEIQANMVLMAFSDSEVKNDKSCSKNYLKNYKALKKLYDDLLVKLSDNDFKAATYKRGSKEYELGLLRTELEKVKQEKDGVDFKIEKFDKSAKDLNEC
ncbi:hypothetical protein Tco_0014041 [Tanacetum coccineum]